VSVNPTSPRVLFLSRDGILDGLGESQVVAYLEALADEYRFWLLSFEKPGDRDALAARLGRRGIVWLPLAWHGRGEPLAAAWGFVKVVVLSVWLVLTRRIRILHARSFLPCIVALVVRVLCLGYPRIVFDMRGFWVDERAEAGGWTLRDVRYRSGKSIERLLLRRAGAIVTLNTAARLETGRLLGRGEDATREITVIPTCVDTDRFRRPVEAPRKVLVLPPPWRDRLVFVYTGAIGYWQHPEALAQFFSVVRQERGDAVFLCLLRTGGTEMRRVLEKAGLTPWSRVEEAIPSADLPRWLAAATVGVVWYRPTFSRIGNFPTKLGEYLACGLPVVVAGATADSVDLVSRERVGAVVREFSPEGYREALMEVLALAKDPATASRCREIAERELSVRVGAARYRAVYRRLAE
jgi:glycosyltransferase involved in cell wall biosynthesis